METPFDAVFGVLSALSCTSHVIVSYTAGESNWVWECASWVLDFLPKGINHDSLLLEFNLVVEAGNPFSRHGYKSLWDFTTINQLQFHLTPLF